MNKITQEILEDIGSLPPEMQEEALDFVRFLKTKQLNRLLDSNIIIYSFQPRYQKLQQF